MHFPSEISLDTFLIDLTFCRVTFPDNVPKRNRLVRIVDAVVDEDEVVVVVVIEGLAAVEVVVVAAAGVFRRVEVIGDSEDVEEDFRPVVIRDLERRQHLTTKRTLGTIDHATCNTID